MLFSERLKNKVDEVSSRIKDKLDKDIVASTELREQRLNMCLACEHYFKVSGLCKKCGCLMKAKTWIAKAKCPIKKW